MLQHADGRRLGVMVNDFGRSTSMRLSSMNAVTT
ncbi:hypothetical protein DSL92_01385 [Billgrantia gudaonensis]|uniref:Uncharacterized protein n=1 Tax=Billgrantia gudaonensis TaxID=376427 RepID=A0A3S0QGB4_9GAMM|nr:hypothetical protein DSL92_01385 [Halomonas gudaonensis]